METMTMIDSKLALKTGALALKQAKEFDNFWRLDASKEPCVTPPLQLEWRDVQIGELLGEGAFSSVSKVTAPRLQHRRQQNGQELQQQPNEPHRSSPRLIRRQYKKINANSSPLKDEEYAIKMMRSKKNPDSHFVKVSAVSLVLEAKMLANLQHDNIIQFYGVKGGCISKSLATDGGYFLVLERLHGTLDVKLKKWLKYEQENVVKRLLKKKRGHHYVPTLPERIESVALGIARAMEYLHNSLHIVYRDLKPQNIGFNKKGRVVLFDFGIAQQLDDDNGPNSVTCKGGKPLTAQVGTFRYMAPENFHSKSYGLPSDVYSYGMLLYAICAMEIPFQQYSTRQLKEHDICGNHEKRPPLDIPRLSDAPQLVQLIQECWDANPERRPTFTEVCARLQEFVQGSKDSKCRQ